MGTLAQPSADLPMLVMNWMSQPSFTQHIPKHKFLIISGDRNSQRSKDENNKFGLYNQQNSEYRADFSLENSLSCLNTKF